MSLEQLGAYLGTDEAKKDVVANAKAAGFDVSEDDLDEISGGDTAGKQFGLRFDRDEDNATKRVRSENPGAVLGKEAPDGLFFNQK